MEFSSDSKQRKIAADAIGYTRQSPEQIAALLQASRDPEDGVRKNAMRALGVLASSNANLAKQIPAETLIDMICSAIWSNRNKASFVLGELTRTQGSEAPRPAQSAGLRSAN